MGFVNMDIDQLLDSTVELAADAHAVMTVEVEIDRLLEKTEDWNTI